MKSNKQLNILTILIILLASIFLKSNAQVYNDTICWVEIIDPTYYASSGPQLSNNSSLNSILSSNGTEYYKQVLAFAQTPELQRIHEVRVSSGNNIVTLHNQLKNSFGNKIGKLIRFEESIGDVAVYQPTDAHYQSGWQWYLNKIGANDAWDITIGDPNIKIAVIDMEIDISNPDLASELLYTYDPYTGIPFGCDPRDAADNPIGHGTAVSVFASGETAEVGETPNGPLASVGFNTKLIVYKTESPMMDNLAKALHASTIEGASVIFSCAGGGSLRCYPPDEEETAQLILKEILDNGTSIVMPAGNGLEGHSCEDSNGDGFPFYPFNPKYDDRIIIVTSTDVNDNHQYFDSSGELTHSQFPEVDICSPGYSVAGTVSTQCGTHPNPYWAWNGTSFATPIVAGAISLMKSYDPNISPCEIKEIIKSSADPVTDASNYPGMLGGGRINIHSALLAMQATSFNIDITNTQVWDNYYYNRGDITIKNGGKLTIKGTVSNAETARIIVEPGGELIVDGGILTSSLCTDFWSGVQVRGNSNLSQVTQNQGAIRLMNDAVIEYANIGIQAYGVDNNGNLISNSGGGIVLITDAMFSNNKIAIKINDYVYNNIFGVPQANESVILSSNIVVDEDYFELTSTDPKGVVLSSVKTVSINGNNFINNASSISGIATDIFNSDVSIQKYIVPNTFNGWEYGVKALGMRSSTYVYLNENVFTNNGTCVLLNGISNSTSIFNEFNLEPTQTGLYLDNCTSFEVEENTFYGDWNPNKPDNTVGLVVNNSTSNINEIYKNYFDKVHYSVLAQNSNRGANGDGLTFKCNTFTENGFDIAVTADPGTTYPGIAAIQGSNANAPDAPAGNIFSYTGPTGTYTDINNEEMNFTYYYHNNLSYNLMPTYYTISTVSATPNLEPLAIWDSENSCPSNQSSGGDPGDIKGAMATAGESAEETNATLLLLTDGGDTPALQTEVESSTPPETMEVYSELISTSPYISNAVVESTIEKEEVIPNTMLRDVMVANPQSAKSEELMTAIDGRITPMPDYMKAQILQGKTIVGAKEQLESSLYYFKNQRQKAYKRCLALYLNDTINPNNSFDSLLVLLESENRIPTQYHLASIYLEKGEINQVTSILNSIPGTFTLNDEQQLMHTQMLNLFGLLIDIHLGNSDLNYLTTLELSLLENLEFNGIGEAKVFARNIRKHIGLSSYSEPYIFPDYNKSSASEYEEQKILQSMTEFKYLNIFPNPAKDYLNIEYQIDNKFNKAFIQITNLSGKILYSQQIHQMMDSKIIDTRGFISGNYLMTIIVDGKALESINFNITK